MSVPVPNSDAPKLTLKIRGQSSEPAAAKPNQPKLTPSPSEVAAKIKFKTIPPAVTIGSTHNPPPAATAFDPLSDTAAPGTETPQAPLPDPAREAAPVIQPRPDSTPKIDPAIQPVNPPPVPPDAAVSEPDEPDTVSPPDTPSSPRKSHWRAIRLTLLAAVLVVILGLTMRSRLSSPPPPEDHPAQTRNADIMVQLVNRANQPLIVRIDNRIIYLTPGQIMGKKVEKGMHEVSWRLPRQSRADADPPIRENVICDADWRFSMKPAATRPKITRTISPHP